jgi:hypothetical protein
MGQITHDKAFFTTINQSFYKATASVALEGYQP